MMTQIDVFADLSTSGLDTPAVADLVTGWASHLGLGSVVRYLSLVLSEDEQFDAEPSLPAGWSISRRSSTEVCSRSFEAAAADQVALLVMLAPVEPSRDAIGCLLEGINHDPLFTFGHARIAEPDQMKLVEIASGGAAPVLLPRRILAHLPEHYIVADFLSPCFVIHPSALEVTALAGPDLRLALADYMVRARRVGMRGLIINNAVVCLRPPMPGGLETPLSDDEETRLLEAHPDWRRAREFGTARPYQRERLIVQGTASRPSLLVDLRNMMVGHNGTAQVGLGLLDGLRSCHTDWDISIWALIESSRFHRLKERYPGWTIVTSPPDRAYSVSIRLSQPWFMREIQDLHSLAHCNFYLMLDNIMWDIIYPAPPGLEGVWRFINEYADGLVFISEFSRSRFLARFGGRNPAPSIGSLLSCDPRDYVDPRAEQNPRGGDFVFLVGNNLDHKDLGSTVETLRRAFPYQSFQVLGLDQSPSPRIQTLPSGKVTGLDVDRLYAGARAVIFPSYYEGFGFPVVAGLSYGRTVLARESDLLHEVAAHYRGPGHLVSFRNKAELVDSLGRLLNGQKVHEVPTGSAVEATQGPRSWREVAGEVIGLAESTLREPNLHRWRERENALLQVVQRR